MGLTPCYFGYPDYGYIKFPSIHAAANIIIHKIISIIISFQARIISGFFIVSQERRYEQLHKKGLVPMDKDVVQEILERVVRIETKIDGYNNLREKLDKTYNIATSNRNKINELRDNAKWLWRTIAGTIIAGIIGALLTFRG